MSTITDAVDKKKHEDEERKPKVIDLQHPPKVVIPPDKGRSRRIKVLLALLVIAAAAAAAGYFYREEIGDYLGSLMAKFAENRPQTPQAKDKTKAANEGVKATVPDEKKVEEKAVEKKEEPVAVEFPELTISGIVFDPIDPEAIINGQSVKTGETINGAYIVEIRKDSVRVRYKGEERVLPYR